MFLNYIHPNHKLGPSRAVFLTGSLFWPLQSAYYLPQGIYWKVHPNKSLQIQFLSNFPKYSFISSFLPISTVLANFERGVLWLGESNGHMVWISFNYIHPRVIWQTMPFIWRLSWNLGRSNSTFVQAEKRGVKQIVQLCGKVINV